MKALGSSIIGTNAERLGLAAATFQPAWRFHESDTGEEFIVNEAAGAWIARSTELDTRYLKLDASNDPITGNLSFADGVHIEIDTVRARDGDGLELFDDGGSGIFVQDGGYVGIGTGTPTGLLHLDSVATPNDSQFLIQANGAGGLSGLVYAADNVMIGFDLYWDGAAWKSLDVGSNFEIYKVSDKLHIRYDSGIAVGNAPTMNPGIVLDTAGKVGIGIVAPLAKLHIDQASTIAAIPVAYFDQADVSEPVFQFETTIGIGNAIEAVGGKTLTVTHFIKVVLPGGLTRHMPIGTIA